MVEMIYDGGDHSSDFADGAMNSSCAVDDSTVPPKPPPNNPLSHQFQPPIMSTSVIVSMNRNGGVSTPPSRRSKTRSTISSLRQRSASLRRRDDEKYREVVDQVIDNATALDDDVRNLSDVHRSCPDLSAVVGGVSSKLWNEILQKTAAEEAKPALKRINVEEEEPKSNDGYEATQVPNGNNAELKSNRSDLTESSTAWADEKLPTRPLMQTSLYELCPAEVFDSLDALVANARLKQPSPDVRTSSFARDDNRENNCGEVIEQNGNGPENTPHRTGSVSSASPRRKSSATPRNAPAIASVPVYRFSSSSESEKGKDEESENEMIFRPPLSKYGYPQTDSKTLVTTYNQFNEAVASETGETLMTRIMNKRRNSSVNIDMEDDFIEGMNIHVNDFDACDDIVLSEADCPQPSRLSQLQWALWRQKNKYLDITPSQSGGTAMTTLNGTATIDGPSNRVCCSLM